MSKIFKCNCCAYETIKKSHYERHLLTSKHQTKYLKYLENEKLKKPGKDSDLPEKEYKCSCGNIYKHRGSLYNHLKVSGHKLDDLTKNQKLEENQVNKLPLKYQLEIEKEKVKTLQEIIDKQAEQKQTINQTNNINLVLNSHCPEALNMNDFVKLLEDNLHRLIPSFDKLLENRYEDNIGNIINENYKEIDHNKKPYYLMDIKRNKLVVKDENNEWVNMTADDDKLHKKITECERKISKKDLFINVVNLSTKEIGTTERKKIIKEMCKEGVNKKDIIKSEEN
jgi:septum formation inhibitor MinC